MDEYCREKGFAGWFETSAKENINIEEAARSLVHKVSLCKKTKLIYFFLIDVLFLVGTLNKIKAVVGIGVVAGAYVCDCKLEGSGLDSILDKKLHDIKR